MHGNDMGMHNDGSGHHDHCHCCGGDEGNETGAGPNQLSWVPRQERHRGRGGDPSSTSTPSGYAAFISLNFCSNTSLTRAMGMRPAYRNESWNSLSLYLLPKPLLALPFSSRIMCLPRR